MSKIRLLQIVLFSILVSYMSKAQEQVYISPTAIVYAGPGSQMACLGPLTVKGIFNTEKGAGTQPVIYLMGSTITIDSVTGDLRSISATDEGGLFIFKGSAAQTLLGGSTSVTDSNSFFPNIELDNSNNLTLTVSGGASNSFKFTSGKLITGSNDFSIGTTAHEGSLTGYDNSKYFVVNNLSTNEAKGYLVRFAKASTNVDYPVGSNTKYEPASLKATANQASMKVRVYSGAYASGFGTSSTVDRSCGFTWDIHPATSTIPTVDITLAHSIADEGSIFGAAPDKSAEYITHYVGTNPNTAGGTTSLSPWDRVLTGAAGVTGTIPGTTTGYSQHTRTGISSFSPFSKALNTDIAPLPLRTIVLEAIAKDNSYALLQWKVEGEDNVDRYDIKKSDRSRFNFNKIGTEYATKKEVYTFKDEDIQQGKVYYYQIVAIDKGTNNKIHSNVASAKFSTDGSAVVVYPNPTSDVLNVSYTNDLASKLNIVLMNNLGQIVATQKLDTKGTTIATSFDVTKLASGTYVILVDNTTTKTQETIKVKINN